MSDDVKQDRSPRSPGISLEAAIDQVAKLHKAIGKSKVSAEIGVKALGYNGLNGAALTTLGSLSQYGLVDRTKGSLSVSPLSFSILFPANEANRIDAIRRAALTPKVFARIRKDFHECTETILANNLVHEGFNHDRALTAAGIYKYNSEFAKLDDPSYVQPDDGSDNREPKPLDPVKPEDKTRVAQSDSPTPGLKGFDFPLSNGTATIRIPYPIEEEDFDFLLETLNLWKKKLIKQPVSPPKQ